MDILTILLSGLLAGLSVTGFFVESAAERALRARFDNIEEIQVRIDNKPSYKLLGGEIDRVRIATRGIELAPGINIDTLEIETDPLNVDLEELRGGGGENFRSAFREPFQAGVRLVLTETDINEAFQSPAIQAQLQQVVNMISSQFPAGSGQTYKLLSPNIKFLDTGRIQLESLLQISSLGNQATQELPITMETGLGIINGERIQLIEPTVAVAGTNLPPVFVNNFTRGISERLNISMLAGEGIQARLLGLEVTENELEIATFIRVEEGS